MTVRNDRTDAVIRSIQREETDGARPFIDRAQDGVRAHDDRESLPDAQPGDADGAARGATRRATGPRRPGSLGDRADAMHVLLIDAFTELAGPLSAQLGPHGLSVLATTSCEEADELLRTQEIVVVLLSATLPDRSGMQYLKLLRSFPATHTLPLIVLGTRSTDIDVALTLDAGADDFVHKPASPRELERRILALLRRCEQPAPAPRERSARRVGPLEYDEETHRVSFDGVPLALRRTEAGLLACLMAAPGRVFTRSQLVRRVCDSESVHERVIDVHVRRLRALLQPVGADGMIDTVRGMGYRLLDSARPLAPDGGGTPDDPQPDDGDEDLRDGGAFGRIGDLGVQGTS